VPYYSAVIQQLIASIGTIHTIIGHSLGSFSTLHAFHEQPSLPVDKLILMAPPGEATDFIDFYRDQLNLSNKTLNLVLQHFEKKFLKPIGYFSTVKFAGDINIPGLIIHDEGDLEAPFHYAKKINEKWPLSKLLATKGLGHNLKSKEVIEEIINFINKPVMHPPMEIYDDTKSTVL
jgi:pimeloyl-ACP methyl ester carboxylesterase